MDLGTLTASLMVNTQGVARAEASMRAFQKNVLASVGIMQSKLNTLGSSYGMAGKAANRAATNVKTAADSATTAMSKAGATGVSSFGNIGASIDSAMMGLRSFGWLATTTLTLPIIGAGKAAINAYKDFEYSMLKIVGLVGIARDQVNEWSKEVRRMATSIGFAPSAIADALYYVTSSGYKTSEALNIVEQSAKAAAAGLGETKDIADLVTSVMNAYGQGNITASRSLDILTAAVREGKGEASQYAKVLGSVVPFAAQLGVQFEEVAGAVAAMTLSGASAANAATYLRNIFMKLLKPAKQSEDALRAMGSSSADLRQILEERGVLAALVKIRELTNKYGDDMMGKVIPNIRAMLAELMLTGKNFEYNAKVMDLVANSSGALANAYQAVYNSLEKRLDRLSASVKNSMITLGSSIKDSLIPILEDLARRLEGLVKWFDGLGDSVKRFITTIAGALAIIGPFSLLISTFGLGLKKLWSTIKGVGTAFTWLRSIWLLNTKGIWNLINTFGKFSVSIATALRFVKSFVGAFGPIGLTVGIAVEALTRMQKKVIEAAVANSVFEKTLLNINGEVKKLNEVQPSDWVTMDYERLMKWNLWAEKSVKNTKEWIKYYYKLAGISEDKAQWATNILAQGAAASDADIKKATKMMGRWKDQIGLAKKDLETGLKILTDTGEALGGKLEEFGRKVTKSIINFAFDKTDVEQLMSLVDEQLTQITDLEKGYRSLGVAGFDATSDKVNILNDALKTLIENGWGASGEAKSLAKQINALGGLAGETAKNISKLSEAQEEYAGKMKVLEYMKANAHDLGLEFDYVAEKTKLAKSTLEKMLENKAVELDILVTAVGEDKVQKFIDDLVNTLKNMPSDVQPVIKVWEELQKTFKYIGKESDIFGPSVDVTRKKMEAVENSIQSIMKATEEMKNLETTTLFDIGLSSLPSNIKVIDWLNFLLEDLGRQYKELQSIATDEEWQKSIDFLNAQAEAFGGVETQLDLVNKQLEKHERRLQSLYSEKQQNTQAWWDEVEAINALRQKYRDIQDISNIQGLIDMRNAMKDMESIMDMWIGTADILRNRLREMSIEGGHSAEEFRKVAKEIKKLEFSAEAVKFLTNSLTDLIDSIGESTENVFDNAIRSIKRLAAEVLAKAIVFALMKIFFKDKMQGTSLLDFIFDLQKQQTQQLQSQAVYSAAKGGIVPPGHPNDTFPALLTSGEMVIPKKQYEGIAPLESLATTGKLTVTKFFPSVEQKEKELNIPKLPKIAALQHGGIIPPGYPNDSYPAMLSSFEAVIPLNKLGGGGEVVGILKRILDATVQGNKQVKQKDPITEGIEKYSILKEKELATYDSLYSESGKIYGEYIDKVMNTFGTIEDYSHFKVKDIKETGEVGLRHGAIVNKTIVADLAKAAAKEDVPLMDALSTAMRETGIGSYMNTPFDPKQSSWYDPREIMQAWSASENVKGAPMEYEKFILKKGLVPKESVLKSNSGYYVDWEKFVGKEDTRSMYKHADKYYDYIKSFKFDESLTEPFRKEMRYLKQYPGQAYNAGEKERSDRLEYDKNVIYKNQDLYTFADSVYNSTKQIEKTFADESSGVRGIPMMTGIMTVLTKAFQGKEKQKPAPVEFTIQSSQEVPDWYTGLLSDYKKKPEYVGPTLKASETLSEKIHNTLSDIATGVTVAPQLRKPTPEEYQMGRGDWGQRAQLMAKSTTWAMVDELTGAAIPAVAQAIPKVTSKLKNNPVYWDDIYSKGSQREYKPPTTLDMYHSSYSLPEKGKPSFDLGKIEGNQIYVRQQEPERWAQVYKTIREANKWQKDWYENPETLKRLDKLIVTQEKKQNYYELGYSGTKFDTYEKAQESLKEISSVVPEATKYGIYGRTGNPSPWNYMRKRIESEAYKARTVTPDEIIRLVVGNRDPFKHASGVSGYGITPLGKKSGRRENLVDPFLHDLLGMKATAIHEGAHGVTNANDYIPKGIQKTLKSSMYKPGEVYKLGREDYEWELRLEQLAETAESLGRKGGARKAISYYREPTEIYARMMEIRHAEGLKPGQKISPRMMDDIMEKGRAGNVTGVSTDFFTLIKNRKRFMNLMNKLPAVGGVGVGIGAMTLGGKEATAAPSTFDYTTSVQGLNEYNKALKTTQELTIQMPTFEYMPQDMSSLSEYNRVLNESILLTNYATQATEESKISKESAAESYASITKEMKKVALLEGTMSTLTGTLTNLFMSIGKSSDEVFAGLFGNLKRLAAELIAKAVVFGIMKILFPEQMKGTSLLDSIMGMQQQQVSSLNQQVPAYAKGGVVPPGYPNDTYLALLSSYEAIIPANKYKELLKITKSGKTTQRKEFLDSPPTSYNLKESEIESLTKKGALPTGDMNDEFQAMLFSYDLGLLEDKLKALLTVPQKKPNIAAEQIKKEKALTKIYNYNGISDRLSRIQKVKPTKESTILSRQLTNIFKEYSTKTKALKQVQMSDKSLNYLSKINKVKTSREKSFNDITKFSKTKVTKDRSFAELVAKMPKPTKITKDRSLDYLMQITKSKKSSNIALDQINKLSKTKVTKDKSLDYITRLTKASKGAITKDKSVGYLSKIARTKIENEKTLNNLVKLNKIRSTKDISLKNLTRTTKSTEDTMQLQKYLTDTISSKQDSSVAHLSNILATKETPITLSDYMKSRYMENKFNSKSLDKISKTMISSKYLSSARTNDKSFDKISKTLVSSKYLSGIARMAKGGIVPKGYPRDTYLARLSSGEKVIPPQKLDHLEKAENNIHITVDGEISGNVIKLALRRAGLMN